MDRISVKSVSKKCGFFGPAALIIALAVIALAGGPSFFFNIPKELRDQICTHHHSNPTCPATSKYRTLDGSCNNKQNPLWGAAYGYYDRLLPPLYSANKSSLQTSVTGNELASPRRISKIIFGNESVPDPKITILVMQFGQFIAHDMSLGLDGSAPSCCSAGVGQYLLDVPQNCFAIPIPSDDPVYSSNLTCMDFVRDVTSDDLACPGADAHPVSQITMVTNYLDLSQVYGSSIEQSNALRTFSGGQLRTVTRNGHEWPPQDPNGMSNCFQDSPDTCFLAGDIRLNQNPHLTIIQVLYLREHNRLARELAAMNPHWTDEKLFQEARRINIGQYQYVAYMEWLYIYLGTDNMRKNGLLYFMDGDEYVNDYNSSVKSTVYNEHATAAFRFFHTQIEGHLNLLSESRELVSTIAMSDVFDNANFTESHFDELGRGMVHQMSQSTDTMFDSEIREFLFKQKHQFGQDLRAIDIQRARDHGLRRYNDYREHCGLLRAKTWSDYSDLIPEHHIENLKTVYEDFEDVELSVGAMLENFVDSTTLAGPTILCILNKQFLVTRVGDRYWFESGDPEVAFSRQQLAEIRKSSFARIFCDNMNNVTSVQAQAFKTVDKNLNPIVPCDEINKVDLSFWRE